MKVDIPAIENITIIIGADFEMLFQDCPDLSGLSIIGSIYDNNTNSVSNKIAEFDCEVKSSTEFDVKLSKELTSELNVGKYNYSLHFVGDTISSAFLKGIVMIEKESDLSNL